MTTLLFQMRNFIATKFFRIIAHGHLQATYIGLYVFLFTIYWRPLVEEKSVSLVTAVAIASCVFVFQDVLKTRGEVKCLANACAIAVFFSILLGWLWIVSRGLPSFQKEVIAWYGQFGAALPISCIAAAIVEEVAFRRYLPTLLRRFLSANWAIVVSAVVFMFAHGFFSLHLLFAGLAFGILATHLGSIHAGVLIHAVINLLGAARYDLTGVVDGDGLSSAIALQGSSAVAQIVSFTLLMVFMLGRTIYRHWWR